MSLVSHGGSAVHQALQPRSGNESSKAPASDLEELTKRCDNFRRAASALQQENTALRAKVLENKELVSVVATLRAENSALRAANLRLREIRGLADAAHENDEENFSPVDGQRVQLVPALTEESEARVFRVLSERAQSEDSSDDENQDENGDEEVDEGVYDLADDVTGVLPSAPAWQPGPSDDFVIFADPRKEDVDNVRHAAPSSPTAEQPSPTPQQPSPTSQQPSPLSEQPSPLGEQRSPLQSSAEATAGVDAPTTPATELAAPAIAPASAANSAAKAPTARAAASRSATPRSAAPRRRAVIDDDDDDDDDGEEEEQEGSGEAESVEFKGTADGVGGGFRAAAATWTARRVALSDDEEDTAASPNRGRAAAEGGRAAAEGGEDDDGGDGGGVAGCGSAGAGRTWSRPEGGPEGAPAGTRLRYGEPRWREVLDDSDEEEGEGDARSSDGSDSRGSLDDFIVDDEEEDDEDEEDEDYVDEGSDDDDDEEEEGEDHEEEEEADEGEESDASGGGQGGARAALQEEVAQLQSAVKPAWRRGLTVEPPPTVHAEDEAEAEEEEGEEEEAPPPRVGVARQPARQIDLTLTSEEEASPPLRPPRTPRAIASTAIASRAMSSDDESAEDEEPLSARRPQGPAKTPTGRPGKTPTAAAAGAKTPTAAAAGAKTPSFASTRRALEQLAPALYAEYNERVFESLLPAGMRVEWNGRLQTTAGRFHREHGTRPAHIELSPKVIDSEEKLRETLAHEMCHAGQRLLDAAEGPPHGQSFWRWAKRFEICIPGMVVRCSLTSWRFDPPSLEKPPPPPLLQPPSPLTSHPPHSPSRTFGDRLRPATRTKSSTSTATAAFHAAGRRGATPSRSTRRRRAASSATLASLSCSGPSTAMVPRLSSRKRATPSPRSSSATFRL